MFSARSDDRRKMRKKVGLTICLALCLLVTVFSAMCLIACNSIYTSNNTPASPKATSFVSIDINPSVDLVLDQNNVVMSANGANNDGKALLFEEDGIVGAELDVAIANLATLAVRYGYVQDGSDVSVEVVSSKEKNDIFEKIGTKFVSAVKKANNNLNVSVSNAVDFVLATELETLKSQYPDNQKIQDLDVATYRLAKRAEQNGIPFEDTLGMSIENLVVQVNELQSELSQKFDSSYKLAVNRAQFVFDSAKQAAESGMYAKYYFQKFIESPLDTSLYKNLLSTAGITIFGTAKTSLEFYMSCVNAIDGAKYKVPSTDADKLSSVLIDHATNFIATHTNNDGDIVFNKTDFDCAVNAAYRNSTLSKDVFKVEYDKAVEFLSRNISYDKEDFSKAKSVVTATIEKLQPMFDRLDSIFKTTGLFKINLSDALNVDTVLGMLFPDDLVYDGVQAVQDKIDACKNIIADFQSKSAITPEDKAQVQTMLDQSDVVEYLNAARTALNTALDQAKSDARTLLLSMKSARLA